MNSKRGREFEPEVRDVARALWSAAPGDGAAQNIAGKERDCIYEMEDIVHYIECTVSRKLEKLKSDAKKMVAYREKSKMRPVKLWFVTEQEPSPEQRSFGKEKGIDVLSLSEFRKKLIDAPHYIELRRQYPFGSAADPSEQGGTDIANLKYQEQGIREHRTEVVHTRARIVELLLQNREVLLLGDYGMGKSLTISKLFEDFAKQYQESGGASPIPLVLNLRDHYGQDYEGEALDRHARNIGFKRPDQLQRALAAGRLVVLLDGFDEVGARPWLVNDRNAIRLKALRAEALRVVKRLADRCRGRCGLLVAGRKHYFDNMKELRAALGLNPTASAFELDEFSSEEAEGYLRSVGFDRRLPGWLPRRPLLLATLCSRGLLDSAIEASESEGPAHGWIDFIDQVCAREQRVHPLLDAQHIRRLLETLASAARSTASGLGPIGEQEFNRAFTECVGLEPDEPARPLLHRLPGMSIRDQQDGTRNFLDDQMLEALRGGDVAHYAVSPYECLAKATTWQHGLQPLGVDVALIRAGAGFDHRRAVVAAREAATRCGAPTLAMDCVLIAREACDEERVDLEGLVIEGADCYRLDLECGALPYNMTVRNSTILDLITPGVQTVGLRLVNCMIETVRGCSSVNALPDWILGPTVTEFDDLSTNNQILSHKDLPIRLRVAMTILRKLYLQRGSSRKEKALTSGLDENARAVVEATLKILTSEDLALSSRRRSITLWHSVAGQRRRVHAFLESMGRSEPNLVKKLD